MTHRNKKNMNKKLFYVALVQFALLLTACDKDKIISQFNQSTKQQTHAQQRQTAPTVQELYFGMHPTEMHHKIGGGTVQTYQSPITYTPFKGGTYYYNKDGELTQAPLADGYYRQVLGKNDEGKTVVQDFYASTNTPFSAPFLIKKDGDERDFNKGMSNGLISRGSGDSLMVWFDKQGSVIATQNHIDGLPIAFLMLVKNGQWIGFVDVYNHRAVFLYPNSQTILVSFHGKNVENGTPYLIYHQNGTAMASLKKEQSTYQIIEQWDETGKPTDSQELTTTLNQTLIPLIIEYFEHTKDFAHTDD